MRKDLLAGQQRISDSQGKDDDCPAMGEWFLLLNVYHMPVGGEGWLKPQSRLAVGVRWLFDSRLSTPPGKKHRFARFNRFNAMALRRFNAGGKKQKELTEEQKQEIKDWWLGGRAICVDSLEFAGLQRVEHVWGHSGA